MLAILQKFEQGYNQVMVFLMVQIYKEANDDRFCRFVPQALKAASAYLQCSVLYPDTKLL
jgi:hypothetical protein